MNVKNLLLGAVIVACLVFSVSHMFGGGTSKPAVRRNLADELAAYIAKEAAAGPKGSLLILAPPDDKKDPFAAELARSAEKQMKSAGFGPVDLERIPYNPALEATGEPVAHDAFLEALKTHGGASVVLSLIGVPRLTDAELPPAGRPRIIVASVAKMRYLRSLPKGMIDFAIDVNQKPAGDSKAAGNVERFFSLYRPQ